jgi:phenylpropionate dioxygenase-like ring-hydroxylating dioxygenase large terminal subunit
MGTAVKIGAAVATVADLPPAGAAVDEVHFVSATGDLWVWVGAGAPGADAASPGGGWQDLGHVQGPQGIKGDPGDSHIPTPTAADAGKLPVVGATGAVTWKAPNAAPTWADVKAGAI